MRSISILQAVCRLLPLVFLLAALGGCLPPTQSTGRPSFDPGRVAPDTPRLNCFLTLKEVEGPVIRLEVSSVEVLAGDLWLPVSSGPLKIDSGEIGAGQLFLGARSLPAGTYHRLRMQVTRGMVRQPDGKYAAVLTEPLSVEVNFTADLNLEQEDSRSLFVTWDVQNSIGAGNDLNPIFTVAPPVRQLLADLVLVACPDIDTVFVVRADKDWVVDSFGLKGGPTYLAVDPDPSRQRLYVLASRDRMVKVVDLSSFQVIDYFPVLLNDAPTFMTISPDGEGAFLLDERNGYLSRIDLATGQSVARVFLGYRPKYAAFLRDQNLLAVSLSLSQQVSLLDPQSLAAVGAIPSGNTPEGLFVVDNQLLIAESGDDTIAVVDMANRSSQNRLTVGDGPIRLIAAGNWIYVSNYKDGSLSVLVPGQLGVVQEIFGLGRPSEMAADRLYRRLYVADDETSSLRVVDVNANQLLGRIVLGARPLGLDVVQ